MHLQGKECEIIGFEYNLDFLYQDKKVPSEMRRAARQRPMFLSKNPNSRYLPFIIYHLSFSSSHSSRKNAGTWTARRAGAREAKKPMPKTVAVTGKKSVKRMEMG